MSPVPGLEIAAIDPAADAKFPFGDLDLRVLALLVLAASATSFSLLC